MKKLFFVSLLLFSACALPARDYFLIPRAVVTSVSFIAGSRVYRIWGIWPGTGGWDIIGRTVLAQMILDREFKFIVDPHRPNVARFGVFGRDGLPQPNAALALLKMGLVRYHPEDFGDGKTHAPYKSSESYARESRTGMWFR